MKFLRACVYAGCILVGIYSCIYDDLSSGTEELIINLRWIKSYPEETSDEVNIGLKWGLSFLGAELPNGSYPEVARWISGNIIELDLSKAGFSRDAEESLKKLLNVFKRSEEYQIFNAIDLGRFIVLTLNSSYHYYAITGAEKSLDIFRNKYSFDSKQFAATKSSVAFGQRLIELPNANDWNEIAFIVGEGEGEIDKGTFKSNEFEVLTIMPNGQLRFALYDAKGELKSAGSPHLTTAGKPAKCLWCHEITLQVLHTAPTPVDGFHSPEEFVQKLQYLTMLIKNYRSTLDGEIDFTRTQEHTLLELLYIGFMEPSPFRLANEWELSIDDIEQNLDGLSTHQHGEFPFLGDKLYERFEADAFSPYSPLKVPEDAREMSSYEPDWFGF